jgi:hypothetical protein
MSVYEDARLACVGCIWWSGVWDWLGGLLRPIEDVMRYLNMIDNSQGINHTKFQMVLLERSLCEDSMSCRIICRTILAVP